MLKKRVYVSKTFLISPTLGFNTIYRNLKTLEEKDTCENERKFHDFLRYMLKEIKEDWDMYKEEKAYDNLYHEHRRNPHGIRSIKDETLLEKRHYVPPLTLPRPSHVLIVDDAQGTDMYTMARKDLMNHISIKYRHIPVTVCFLVQSWTGIPRVIRLNATHFIIYKTGDSKQLQQIYAHFGTYVT